MKRRTKLIIIVIFILVVLALIIGRILMSSSAPDTRRQNIPLVKLESPRQEAVATKLEFTGDVVAVQQAGIFSKVTGNLEKNFVDMGTEVRRNQVLALIDTTELYQQYQQASATYQNARLTYKRSKELSEQNLVARQDLDNAEATMKVSAAAFDAATTRLGYARISAPFAGTITRRYLDAGALVTTSNSTLFTLMDLNTMKITISVLERDIPLVTRGKKATITVDAFPGRTFMGDITRLSEAVDPSTRTMAIEIDIPNPDHSLKPGMYAKVVLVVDERPHALTVPTIAVMKDDKGFFVYTAVGDTARKVPVTAGVEQDARTEITSGLREDQPIITTGQQFVRDGGPISVQR